jgi:hypothetical protein
MTTIERPVAARYYRCGHFADTDARQCELEPAHPGVHAIRTPDGYMTWDEATSARSWRLNPPPAWLVALAWAPGFQPEIRLLGSDAASRFDVDERYES